MVLLVSRIGKRSELMVSEPSTGPSLGKFGRTDPSTAAGTVVISDAPCEAKLSFPSRPANLQIDKQDFGEDENSTIQEIPPPKLSWAACYASALR